MVLTLGLDPILAIAKDHSDYLLGGGMVHGDIEQVAGGMGL